jgi:hypothetical protein
MSLKVYAFKGFTKFLIKGEKNEDRKQQAI